MFYLCSHAVALKGTASAGSVEAVSRTAPCGRAVGVGNATSRREEGTRKEFQRRVADNASISLDSPPKMEGIGSDFRRFGSSRTSPGRADDRSPKSPGAWPEANAAYKQGVLRVLRQS